MSFISIVCFAYNEEENIPRLYERLVPVMASLGVRWEWIVVDDHSSDGTFAVVTQIAESDPGVRGVRLSRNFGAHSAKACGLHVAAGDCAIAMAADLQDPPELIPALVERWRAGAQVVSAARAQRLGERSSTILFSRLYHYLMRDLVGLKEMPPTGDSYCLLDRRVLEAFRRFEQASVPVTVLINWMGYRHERIPYDQQARVHGRSGWTLEKKLRLAVDSVTSFSDVPIRFMSYAGMAVAAAGLLSACWAIVARLSGAAVPGWTWVLLAVLVIGGLQMVMLGVLGEYLWRSLIEAQRRPRYLIEATVGMPRDSRAADAVILT